MPRPRTYKNATERKQAWRRRNMPGRIGKQHLVHNLQPPPHVVAARDRERQRLLEFDLTPNMVVLGDPPPWRSALGLTS